MEEYELYNKNSGRIVFSGALQDCIDKLDEVWLRYPSHAEPLSIREKKSGE
jgi:hypothetical protein